MMETRIGSDLKRARTRREVELEEVETATRIRVRFLEAIEHEEWEALPGGVYTRGFIRTYANFLGMDGERLARDYREQVEGAPTGRGPDPELGPVAASTATGSPGGRRSARYLRRLAVPIVLGLAAVAIFVLPDGSGDGDGGGAGRETPPERDVGRAAAPAVTPAPTQVGRQRVELRLSALAEVWVCLLDGKDEALIEGEVLEAGVEEGPFRSGSFTVSLGNGEVMMTIDGEQAEIPTTSSPIGYAIDASGELTELEEGERPTCT